MWLLLALREPVTTEGERAQAHTAVGHAHSVASVGVVLVLW